MSHDQRISAYRDRFDNHIVQERVAKVDALREAGTSPFANGFEVTHTAAQVYAEAGALSAEELTERAITVSVAGRLRLFRKMGKAAFLKIADRTCRDGLKGAPSDDNFLQVFVSLGSVGQELFDRLLTFDLGDILGFRGTLMRTKTGELSVAATEIIMLTKSIRPLPDKFKGLSDVEQRYRMRYVDLVMNDEVREVFYKRTRIVSAIRSFLDRRDYLEVETPMMHATPGGAAARPFATHHNALNMQLFMRIAPELYLKRLLVGGMERVYEINRNFRNEGLSRKHNPEFTMLEFYQAYATWEDLMELTEEMLCEVAATIHTPDEAGAVRFIAEEQEVSFARPWRRLRMSEGVAEALGVDEAQLDDIDFLREAARKAGADVAKLDKGKLLVELFERRVEHTLIQPTFVVDFPASASPLARRKESNPELVDRFELYVLGRELANAFSELNDPEDQYGRFAAQLEAKAGGDEEAMPMDEDYVRALEYGMPPAAGEGIGIDRLVMLLTDSASIRDVILFPHMRPE
jgi:lysyl-tRNA synthetase class 2